MQQITVPAGTVIAERTYGTAGITVSLSTAVDGFTVNIRTGTIRHGDLAKSFTDVNDALAYGGQIRTYALNGMMIVQITAKLGLAASYEWHTAPVDAEIEKPAARIVELFGRNRRQTRPTMAGAHLKDLSPPQLREIAAHRDGIVYLRPGCDKRMLASIERKGYGHLNYETGRSDRRQVIESLTLNPAGLRAAGTALAAA